MNAIKNPAWIGRVKGARKTGPGANNEITFSVARAGTGRGVSVPARLTPVRVSPSFNHSYLHQAAAAP